MARSIDQLDAYMQRTAETKRARKASASSPYFDLPSAWTLPFGLLMANPDLANAYFQAHLRSQLLRDAMAAQTEEVIEDESEASESEGETFSDVEADEEEEHDEQIDDDWLERDDDSWQRALDFAQRRGGDAKESAGLAELLRLAEESDSDA